MLSPAVTNLNLHPRAGTEIRPYKGHLESLTHGAILTKGMVTHMKSLTYRGGALPLSTPCVMGVLNVTPDSFSDGGRYNSPDAAAAHAREMAAAGAGILDIGAQSTRPGAVRLSDEEEWARLEPCLRAVTAATALPISVDTFYPTVAARALEAGAHILNDVSGSEHNGMAQVAASYGAGMIFMRTGAPESRDATGDAVVDMTRAYFRRALALADAAGLPREVVCLDVGVGFGSSPQGDLALVARLPEILDGLPEVAVLVGASRKRVVSEAAGGVPLEERLAGTLALHTVALWNGAHIVRAHDVKEAVQAAAVTGALCRAKKERDI